MKTTIRTLAVLLALALAAAACSADSTSSTTQPDAVQVPPADAIDVTIGDVEFGPGEVTVRGEKPTPCNDLGSIVSPGDGVVEIQIWAEPTDEICAQVIEPFEVAFALPDVESETVVRLNGEEIGRIDG